MGASNVAIVGASGGIGNALASRLAANQDNQLYCFSRSKPSLPLNNAKHFLLDYHSETSIKQAAENIEAIGGLDLVIVATGVLKSEDWQPEKTMKELNSEHLHHDFHINTVGPSLVAKHFLPLMNKNRRNVFAVLSARVGSISDNGLGGWHAYRASKAAVNMIIKCLSIEQAYKNKHSLIVGLHPGTVDTALSKPFQKRIPSESLFDATTAATNLLSVIDGLAPKDSGNTFAWDGKKIPF
jgi:NAD(P)-dependent dehydrogenase (short-subunit alcohol dehydrogenase family)